MVIKMMAVLLVAVLASAAPAAVHASSVYSMGPTYRFEPELGDEAALIPFANGYIIDTRDGEPEIPEPLRLTDPGAEPGYHIVQFAGPVRQPWLRDLRRLGARPVGYLPNHAVVAKLSRAAREAVARQAAVRWVGLFQPAYKIEAGLLDATGLVRVVVLLWPEETPDAVIELAGRLGCAVGQVLTTGFGTTIDVTAGAGAVPAIARLQAVQWVQRHYEVTADNVNAQWVVQTGWRASAPTPTDPAARRVWTNGVRGQRVVLSTSDTGNNMGHDLFRDPAMSVTPPGIWPDHRKVVAFKLYQGADVGENTYHGSHVNGTVCGDDSVTGGTSYNDGMSIKGRLYFVDVTNSGGGFVIGNDLTPLWDTVHQGRGLPDSLRPIKQHSGSWGSDNFSGTYLVSDASTDAYCWAHKDFLSIMSAGNEGSAPTTIGNPGIAKNVVTVGATGNGTGSNSLAGFSSRGPTQDNRVKPTLCAPGENLTSAYYTGSNTYQGMSGTSMSAPAVNGTIGLLRCYLAEGYYPTGSPVPANRFSYISSALLRSMAVASADPNVGGYTVPSFDIGWGRIDADSVLYFTGDTRRLIIRDDTTGLATGEYRELQFSVNSAMPLRVALAWTDTAAAPNANPTLVNNLNLELTAPGGTFYRGNQYSGGQSQANPGSWDTRNTEECARINSPATGAWTLRVLANQVSTGARQPFAVTVTGDVSGGTVSVVDVGVTVILAPSATVDSGAVIPPQARVKNFGTATATFPVNLRIGAGYSNTQTVTSLAPGDSVTVTFANWTALQRGSQAVRCSTGLSGDENRANDTLSGTVFVRVTNVGVTQILAPVGTVDSGTMTTPRARFRNYGTNQVSFPVTFTIGGFYTNTQNVTNLNPGDSATINFANWTALQRGTFTTRCTAALAGDQIPGNNLATGTVTVRVLNAGVTQILAPSGTLDSGATVTPRARVKNLGSITVSFPVNMKIGAFYNNTQNVTSLAPGDSFTVNFINWTVTQRGTHVVRCTTALAGDVYRANDTLSGSVTVRVLNVGVTAILAPIGVYDSGAVVTPYARVRNWGSGAAAFPVTFRIGTFYTDVQNVTGLAPGDSTLVGFANWTALQRGVHTTRCTTALAGDLIPSNDALSGSVTVRVPGDVGVSRINAPAGTLDSGASVIPQAVVRNFGGSSATFPVTFRISTFYADTKNVTDLAQGDSAVVDFAVWDAVRRGTHAVGCTTTLAGDTVAANNGATGSFFVRVQDAGVIGIASPAGAFEPGKVVTPAASVRNYGNAAADFDVWMLINDPTGARVYAASAGVAGLAPGSNALVNAYPACTLRTLGNWTARCSVVMIGDVNPENDVISQGFRIISVWVEVKSVPGTPSGVPVKDGAWLAYHAANGLVYSAKGNKTPDFYSYSPGANAWTQRPLIPYGVEAKPPRKGTCGTSDGSRYVYMAKGNNTLGFWRYDVATDSWLALANVPVGSNNVKGGADAVFVNTGGIGYVYLLKGGGPEFCRYSTVAGTWQGRASAPVGSNPKWDKGSFLAFDGNRTIYAHKAKYNELWSYNVETDSWRTSGLAGMPFVGRTGRSKKSKDGGSGAWVAGYVYALKGGNTTEFWRYNPATNAWAELDTMPSRGSTNKTRRVNAGGDIVNAGGTLYALKGSKTYEFWRYTPGLALLPAPERQGVMAAQSPLADWRLTITPNPLASGLATIRFSSPLSSSSLLRVYDASGCLILQSEIRNLKSEMTVDLRSLPAGVYLAHVAGSGFSATQKLIVQR